MGPILPLVWDGGGRVKTLMYPIAPEDDFPEMFCAIRLYDGERRFYKPEGEHTNSLLSRMGKEATEREDAINTLTDENVRLRIDNAMLRELAKEMWPHVRHRSRMCRNCNLPCDTSDECLLYEPMRQRMRKLGIEVE